MDWWGTFAVLNPQGPIALAERGLMLHALLFMLIVAIPVLGLLFFFTWHYRAGNKKAHYAPNWGSGHMEELVWWVIPFEIILILGALTWSSTHELDPRKPLQGEPLVVQVVALDWKWLFIYPEEGIASVNEMRFPAGKPVRFEITADAPMNSFWIPELGGQIYAMTGMVTTLNLSADKEGTYKGLSANYSGEGFAKMHFSARASSQESFDAWVAQVKGVAAALDAKSYADLAEHSVIEPRVYGSVDPRLYNEVVAKFADPARRSTH